MEQTSNSVIVYIRRLPQFATAARKELEAHFAEGQRGYGAYFAKGSARTATGLTIPEEDLLMPLILCIPKDDRDFRTKVNTHFESIEVKVPAYDGLKLEVGLSSDNSKPVAADNMPIALDDYIKYRHALGHPWMAPSMEDGKGNQLKQYYIFNPGEVSKSNVNVNELKDKALGYYLTLKGDTRKVAMYLTLLGVRSDDMPFGEQVIKLRSLTEADPQKFIDLYNDRNKEIKYAIEDMINKKVLKRVKSAILVESDGTIIGNNLDEAIVYLQDARNTRMYNVLKSRLQEKWKNVSSPLETDEDLPPVTKPVAEPEEIEPATELMPAAPEPEGEFGNAFEEAEEAPEITPEVTL